MMIKTKNIIKTEALNTIVELNRTVCKYFFSKQRCLLVNDHPLLGSNTELDFVTGIQHCFHSIGKL